MRRIPGQQADDNDDDYHDDHEAHHKDIADHLEQLLDDLGEKLGKDLGLMGDEVLKALDKAAKDVTETSARTASSPRTCARHWRKRPTNFTMPSGKAVLWMSRRARPRTRPARICTKPWERPAESYMTRCRNVSTRPGSQPGKASHAIPGERGAGRGGQSTGQAGELEEARKQVRQMEQELRRAMRRLEAIERRQHRRLAGAERFLQLGEAPAPPEPLLHRSLPLQRRCRTLALHQAPDRDSGALPRDRARA